MSVLITGASGRVGANVVRRLVEAGRQVVAMVPPNDPLRSKLDSVADIEIVEADLTDQEAINSAVKGRTAIVHLAAQLNRNETPVDKFFDINAFGTLRLLEAVVRHAPDLERFVLASTDGTYRPGAPTARPLAETSPLAPADYYGSSKLLGEVILQRWADQYDIPHTVVRFGTILSPEEAVSRFRYEYVRGVLSRAALGRESNIWHLFHGHPDMLEIVEAAVPDKEINPAVALRGPDGTPWTLHLADVRDIVQGVLLALDHPAALGETFNIAGPHPTGFDEGAAIVAKAFDVPSYTVDVPVDWHLDMDVSKAQRLLGFAPEFDFARMVADGLKGTSVIPARV
ncbi:MULTISPECIES: NAD-dependent epimerase/dehydratase family protein [Amycolatopsis]|uniref:UDP-glucose 4-epimerase n=2 Tax=Amycolatopsis TaxID=1813 RepID=A0A1I3V0X3_9PSEU|nr:NAD(P)-dependent oxidoreductase [Amycolatopsis sacchari]SFJ88599.1 UDP-glucose 4-epimerase [Amycolatopsis sacchari]